MTSPSAEPALIRRPAVAGRFYPASERELSRAVDQFLDEAHSLDPTHVRGLIVPHAGYVCSGVVAAAGFRALMMSKPVVRIVYIMGPAHRMPVHGIGMSSADGFETPLGVVPVATDAVHALLGLGAPYRTADEAHAPEHCLEVELPFLQSVLPEARIIPMLFDEGADPARVADDLASRLEQEAHSLVVVSSDLSHYLPYAQARELDRALLDAVARGDQATARRGQACGMVGILTLMAIAERLNWTPKLADYRNSGDTCSLRTEVVGYGAVVYAQ